VYKRRIDSATGKLLGDEEKHDIVYGKAMETKEIDLGTGNATCGSCYGAEDRFFENQKANITCCSSCKDVHSAYSVRRWQLLPDSMVHQCRQEMHANDVNAADRGEGCRLRGSLRVNKVAGNFHFAPGRSYQKGSVHVHDLLPFADKEIDFGHLIHHLSFGYPFPGISNPLDRVAASQKSVQNPINLPGMFQYFLKVRNFFRKKGRADVEGGPD